MVETKEARIVNDVAWCDIHVHGDLVDMSYVIIIHERAHLIVGFLLKDDMLIRYQRQSWPLLFANDSRIHQALQSERKLFIIFQWAGG